MEMKRGNCGDVGRWLTGQRHFLIIYQNLNVAEMIVSGHCGTATGVKRNVVWLVPSQAPPTIIGKPVSVGSVR